MTKKQLVLNHRFQEQTKHRTGLVPARCYVTAMQHLTHGRLPLHWHEEMQWVLMLEGEAMFHVPKERIHLTEGEALFINSGRMHAAEAIGELPCVYLCLNAAPSLLLPSALYGAYIAPFLHDDRWTYRRWEGDGPSRREIVPVLNDIKQVLDEQRPGFELMLSKRLSYLWTWMIRGEDPPSTTRSGGREEQAVKTMIQWIQDHYAEPIRLDDIAHAGLLSRSECCRYFQRVLQTTPMSYVKDYRLQQGMDLLQQSEESVTAIAYRTGFSSASHFISIFRSSMHMTPLAYRKSLDRVAVEEMAGNNE